MVFGKNQNFPVSLNSNWPALEGVTFSQVVADNLNAMHAARHAFIQNESSEKFKCALTQQIRTSGDDTYTTGDLVFYKRENSEQSWSRNSYRSGWKTNFGKTWFQLCESKMKRVMK